MSQIDGRWWSPDPLESNFPWQSPYVSMDGNPINKTDVNGDKADKNDNDNYRVDLNIGVNFLSGKGIGFHYNLTATLGFQIQGSVGNVGASIDNFLSMSVYGGNQLGTGPNTSFGMDISGGSLMSLGTSSAKGHDVPLLNYNTISPFQNEYKNSLSWGQMFTLNSPINIKGDGPGLQKQGMAGLRLGDFSFMYHNDATVAPTWTDLLRPNFMKDTDAAWTGGIFMNINEISFGQENFTVFRTQNYPGGGVGTKYKQTEYHESLNKVSNFLRYKGYALEIYTSPFLQNIIHNKFSNEATYNNNNFGIGVSKRNRVE